MSSTPPDFKQDKTCCIESCGGASVWTPVFYLLPPDRYHYRGKPIEAIIGATFCEAHRDRALEDFCPQMAKTLAESVREQGRPVDDAKTTWDLLRL